MMRSCTTVSMVFGLFALRVIAGEPNSSPKVDVLFSPNGGCTDRIVSEIKNAKSKIRVQAYSFTSARIAGALLAAKKRGVDCEVILDKSQQSQSYSELDFFHNQGIPTLIDDAHAIAHNKIILIDDSTIIMGSFNFTKAAEESNAENVLIIAGDSDLSAKYAENYTLHREHSRAYQGRVAAQRAPPPPSPSAGTPAPAPFEANSTDVTVYVTRTGKKYHQAGCSYLRSSTPMKLREAKQRYEGCSKCKPP